MNKELTADAYVMYADKLENWGVETLSDINNVILALNDECEKCKHFDGVNENGVYACKCWIGCLKTNALEIGVLKEVE